MRAAFRVEEGEQVLECGLVGGVPEVGAFAADANEVFVAEFVEVMGEGGSGDAWFGDEIAHEHAGGMCRQEEAKGYAGAARWRWP